MVKRFNLFGKIFYLKIFNEFKEEVYYTYSTAILNIFFNYSVNFNDEP